MRCYMARYRTYKNGIYGHRYKDYYIIKGEKHHFSILDKNGNVYQENVFDFEECEWIIDKAAASENDLIMIQLLYQKEIYQLSALFVELMQKKQRDKFNQEEESLYKWVEKVRKRKAEDRTY